jgi:hypothetical protein
MKRIFVFLMLWFSSISIGATFTSAATGNWNASATWGKAGAPAVEGTDYPGPNDAAVIATGHVVALNIARIPTSGTLLSLTGTGTGQLTVNLNTSAFGIYASTIQAGTNNTGFILVTGATNILTIVGNVTGGSTTTGASCVRNDSTGTVNITGNVTAGSTTTAHGAINTTTGVINITGNVSGSATANVFGCSAAQGRINIFGNVTGGTTGSSNGCSASASGGIYLTGNLIFSTTTCTPSGGFSPVLVPTKDSYIQFTGYTFYWSKYISRRQRAVGGYVTLADW